MVLCSRELERLEEERVAISGEVQWRAVQCAEAGSSGSGSSGACSLLDLRTASCPCPGLPDGDGQGCPFSSLPFASLPSPLVPVPSPGQAMVGTGLWAAVEGGTGAPGRGGGRARGAQLLRCSSVVVRGEARQGKAKLGAS